MPGAHSAAQRAVKETIKSALHAIKCAKHVDAANFFLSTKSNLTYHACSE